MNFKVGHDIEKFITDPNLYAYVSTKDLHFIIFEYECLSSKEILSREITEKKSRARNAFENPIENVQPTSA